MLSRKKRSVIYWKAIYKKKKEKENTKKKTETKNFLATLWYWNNYCLKEVFILKFSISLNQNAVPEKETITLYQLLLPPIEKWKFNHNSFTCKNHLCSTACSPEKSIYLSTIVDMWNIECNYHARPCPILSIKIDLQWFDCIQSRGVYQQCRTHHLHPRFE